MTVLSIFILGLQLVNQYHYFKLLPGNKPYAAMQLNNKRVFSKFTDEYNNYYPQVAVLMFHNIWDQAMINPKYGYIHHMGRGRYFLYSRQYCNKVTVPFIRYRGITYQIHYDNHLIRVHNDHHDLMIVNNVSPGKHMIRITPEHNITSQLSKVVTSVGFLTFLWIIFRRFYKKHFDSIE